MFRTKIVENTVFILYIIYVIFHFFYLHCSFIAHSMITVSLRDFIQNCTLHLAKKSFNDIILTVYLGWTIRSFQFNVYPKQIASNWETKMKRGSLRTLVFLNKCKYRLCVIT